MSIVDIENYDPESKQAYIGAEVYRIVALEKDRFLVSGTGEMLDRTNFTSATQVYKTTSLEEMKFLKRKSLKIRAARVKLDEGLVKKLIEKIEEEDSEVENPR
jgi:hypothetical protein